MSFKLMSLAIKVKLQVLLTAEFPSILTEPVVILPTTSSKGSSS
jgi:hypothetical protein